MSLNSDSLNKTTLEPVEQEGKEDLEPPIKDSGMLLGNKLEVPAGKNGKRVETLV